MKIMILLLFYMFIIISGPRHVGEDAPRHRLRPGPAAVRRPDQPRGVRGTE